MGRESGSWGSPDGERYDVDDSAATETAEMIEVLNPIPVQLVVRAARQWGLPGPTALRHHPARRRACAVLRAGRRVAASPVPLPFGPRIGGHD